MVLQDTDTGEPWNNTKKWALQLFHIPLNCNWIWIWTYGVLRERSCSLGLNEPMQVSTPCPELLEHHQRKTARKLRKPNLPVTSATAPSRPPKRSSIVSEGSCCNHMHRYCAGVSKYHYLEMKNSSIRRLCTCVLFAPSDSTKLRSRSTIPQRWAR